MALKRSNPTLLRASHLPLRRELEHELEHEVLAHLGRLRRRRRLLMDKVFRARRAEIDLLLGGFEWDLEVPAPQEASVGRLRCVAWNIERGKRFTPLVESLTSDPALVDSDLILLTEVDKGMGRSGNRNVAQDLARETGLSYVFCNHHLVLTRGDRGEQDHDDPNTWSMHGSALLSRLPITRFTSVRLPEYLDKFHDYEKRLGDKRALIAEVQAHDGPLTVVVVHLDPFAPPRHRVFQMRLIIKAVRKFGGTRVLMGGDLNTNTYDVSKGPNLLAGMLFKLSRLGVEGAIEHYLEPEKRFERRLFELLREVGFSIDDFNCKATGTLFYDAHDPEIIDKARAYLPKTVINRVQNMLVPWEGLVPMNLDWWAAHGIEALHTEVVNRPEWRGKLISDHYPIVLEAALGEGEGLKKPASPIRGRPLTPPRVPAMKWRRRLKRQD